MDLMTTVTSYKHTFRIPINEMHIYINLVVSLYTKYDLIRVSMNGRARRDAEKGTDRTLFGGIIIQRCLVSSACPVCLFISPLPSGPRSRARSASISSWGQGACQAPSTAAWQSAGRPPPGSPRLPRKSRLPHHSSGTRTAWSSLLWSTPHRAKEEQAAGTKVSPQLPRRPAAATTLTSRPRPRPRCLHGPAPWSSETSSWWTQARPRAASARRSFSGRDYAALPAHRRPSQTVDRYLLSSRVSCLCSSCPLPRRACRSS